MLYLPDQYPQARKDAVIAAQCGGRIPHGYSFFSTGIFQYLKASMRSMVCMKHIKK